MSDPRNNNNELSQDIRQLHVDAAIQIYIAMGCTGMPHAVAVAGKCLELVEQYWDNETEQNTQP